MDQPQLNYRCPKCGSTQYEIGEFRAAGGFWSKVFDIQGQKFATVICAHCRYTEIYHADQSKLGSIFDLFMGG